MNGKQKAGFSDTYILDEDVMNEMENLEVTQVLQESEDELATTRTQENKFLDDVEEGTVVLDNNPEEKED